MNWKHTLHTIWSRRRSFFAAILAGSLLPLVVSAQEAEEATEEATEEEKTDILVLSPFVVDETATIGYQATQTLAGTRIATELKDVAASIFVFTPELIEDTGMTNIQDAFMYGANTEGRDTYTVAGVGFTGRSESVGAYSASHSNPQGNQRVRGLTSADVSRGYFTSLMPMDFFSIEQATLLRGPNSIMFGLGSPAGIFDYTPKRAKFRDKGEISFRFNQYGGERYVFDINKELLEDELAVRVVGLYEDERFDQEPAHELDKRIFITGTWQPFKGKTGTTVRATAEFAYTSQLYPSDTTGTEGYRKWLDAGGEGWDHTLNRTIPWDPTGNTSDPLMCPANNVFVGGVCRDLNGDPLQAGFPPSLGIGRGNIRGIIFVDNQCGQQRTTNDPNCDFVIASDRPQHAGATVTINGQGPRQGFTGTAGRFDGIQFEVEDGIVSRDLWDWKNWNITVFPGGARVTSASTWNLTLEQKLFDNFHIEAGINQERFGKGQNSPSRGGKIHIDPNITRADGSPNPWYLRPVTAHSAISQTAQEQYDEYRVTATYNLNLEEKLGKWFGKHNLIGHYNNLEATIREYSGRDIALGNSPDFYQFTNPRPLRSGSFPILTYMGPAIDPSTDNVRAMPGGPAGFKHNWNFFDRGPKRSDVQHEVTDVRYFTNYTVDDSYNGVAGAEAPSGTFLFAPGSTDRATGTAHCVRDRGNLDYRVNCVPVDGNPMDSLGNPLYQQRGVDDFLRSGFWSSGGTFTAAHENRNDITRGLQKNLFESVSFVSQSHMFKKGPDSDDHFAVVTYGWRRDTVNSFAGNPPAQQINSAGFYDFTPQTWKVSDTALGAELVENSTSIGVVGHPLKWLSAYYNKSKNFRSSGLRVTLFGDDIGPEKGSGEDYGFSLNLFKGKLNARINWFNVEQKNVTAGGVHFIAFWRLNNLEQVVERRVCDGLGSTQPLPVDRSSECTPAPSGYPGRVGFLGAVTNFSAEGNEIEITANPWRNLRIMFNAGRQRTIQSDIAPFIKEWIAQRTAAWEGETWYSRTGKNTGKIGANGQDTGLDLENGAITWSDSLDETCNRGDRCTIEEWFNSIVTDPLSTQLVQEGRVNQQQPEWHWAAVANYTFDQGFLKGLNIGGALRWNDEQVIGYDVGLTTIDGQEVLTSDLDSPYFGDSDMYADLWFGYQRPIMDGKVTWKVQMNIRNVGTDASLDPIATHLDGTPARYRIVNESNWFITNSFRF